MTSAKGTVTSRCRSVGVAAVGGLLSAGSIYFWNVRIFVSVLIGAFVALLNLWALAKIVRSMMPEDEPGEAPPPGRGTHEGHVANGKAGGAAFGLLAVIKILGLFGGAFVLWKSGVALPLPTLVGYGALPLGIVFTAVMAPQRR